MEVRYQTKITGATSINISISKLLTWAKIKVLSKCVHINSGNEQKLIFRHQKYISVIQNNKRRVPVNGHCVS